MQEGNDDVAETTAGHDLTGNKESGGRAVNAGEETVCETDNSGKTTGENDTGGTCVEIVSSDGEESENANNQINDFWSRFLGPAFFPVDFVIALVCVEIAQEHPR